jgi:hypothetical protein
MKLLKRLSAKKRGQSPAATTENEISEEIRKK